MKYAPFSSLIDLQFYYSLASHKIDYDKLDESPRKVLGQYLPHDGGRMQVHGNALTSDEVPITACRAEGMIKNYNTIEDFRKVEKIVMIKRSAQTIWGAILDGSIYSCPSLLSSFLILSYADLKRYKFHHLFAFPAFAATPQWTCNTPIERLDPHQTSSLVEAINTWRYSTDSRQHGFFLVKRDAGTWKIGSLGDFEHSFFDKDVDEEDRFVGFVDPSDYPDNPGWPLRNLLMLVRKRWGWRKVRVLCLEELNLGDEMPKVVGWEKNDDNKIVPKIANLSAQMDPKKQADINVDLNLKLMKWRVAPELDLDVIRNTRCLLLGAGTLGAYVARNLLSWGVHKITFIDSGTVSFSNPVRQPLYTFQDCIGGETMKAIRAAEALKEIYPGVDAQGFDMTVPMAAHPFSDTQEAGVKQDYLKLRRLFDEHDAIFLLMDTRESRWLPTVMGKSMKKLVMNAALGFDSYVVMRHGVKPSDDQKGGEELGCYYCSDVVAPGDSLVDRTLDQQCTVTRPGVAPIASALLVETLVSVLQHPLGAAAPAPNNDKADRNPPNHPLGLIAHQMRGFLSSFQNIMLKGPAYNCCSACSPAIIKEYRDEGWDFVKKALNQRGYVEEISGLLEVQRRADEADMTDWGDSGDGDEDGDGM
ncbi:unnamed protein product [Tuber melanosporum]|uniref:Ubiquitin-like modifier-activating enzyme ATG7 n=1 Tax=Tuber melanosporum (strain Mel28) TaxID=656061 RepID=D5GBP9_TUBMM|nr:uncharacterized protein GSTUM_00005517001 [Tuber melanosporum]CAZ81899.1 unnamed protein product [Tuber melanosporum]